MLAIKLEMINQLPSLEETRESAKYSDSPNISSTARLLDEWETKQGSSIGNIYYLILKYQFDKMDTILLGVLMTKLEEIGREDAVSTLLSGCSSYRILTPEEAMSPESTHSSIDTNDNSL